MKGLPVSGTRPRGRRIKKTRCRGKGIEGVCFSWTVIETAERNTPDAATPQHLIRVFLAGLRAWKSCCLAFPEQHHSSGIVRQPHFLTVAGAAPELIVSGDIAPASRFIRPEDSGADTTNGAQYSRGCALRLFLG